MNGNQKGCFAEYHFATTAIKQGFNVSMPLLDSSVYDCILEKNGKLFKFQVKYLGANRYKHGRSIQIVLKRTGTPTYDSNYVDYFALWSEEYQGFFILKNEGQKSLRLSLHNKYKENFNNFACIS
jgi:hypothetical protein|tara:strand:+ start:79 stop:453 length:375 start_codon:yes stop_codon:yes gene_type:complete